MKKLLGKRLTFTATRGRVSLAVGTAEVKKVCINNIKLNGKEIKDHAWVEWNSIQGKIESKREFEFVATVAQYISLNENYEQVIKYRFVKIRHVKELA